MADIISGPLAEPKDRRGLLRPEYSLDGGLSWQPWTGSQSIGDLAVGERVTVLLRGVVDPLTTGILTNVAQVSSPTPDPNPDNNTATVETPVTEQADLSVVKVGAPKPAAVGDLVTYTLAVANAGPVNAENTVLSDPLPEALASPEVSLDGGRSFQPWAGTLALGTLLPGQAQTILLRGTVRASADALLINTATVQSDTPDPNPDNNTDTEELPVQLAADLAITKVADTDTAAPGGLLTYTLTIANLGPATAQDVLLTDQTPGGLSRVEVSLDNGRTWTPWTGAYSLGALPAGQGRTLLLRGSLSSSAQGTLVNTAVVASSTPDPNPNSNTATSLVPVQGSTELRLTKTSPCWAVPCQYLVYRLVAVNWGSIPAEGVVVQDHLPPSLSAGVYSLDGGITWRPWQGLLSFGTLAPGATATLLVAGVVHPCAQGTITNTAVISSQTAGQSTAAVTTPVWPPQGYRPVWHGTGC